MSKTTETLNKVAETAGKVAETANAVAGAVGAVKAAFAFKRTKVITVPLLKPAIDVPVYIRADAPIYVGKKIDDKMEAAHLLNCTNLESGEMNQLIIPAVLLSLFSETYENDSYVGKCFEVTKHPKPSGKGYHPFSLNEIEVE